MNHSLLPSTLGPSVRHFMVTLAPFEIRHCPSVATTWSRPGCRTVNSSQMSPGSGRGCGKCHHRRTAKNTKSKCGPSLLRRYPRHVLCRSVFLNSLPYQPGPVPLTQVLTTVMSVRCGLGRKPLVRRFNSDRGLHLIKFLSIKSETRLSSISSVMSGR